jgi:hypothetical protein
LAIANCRLNEFRAKIGNRQSAIGNVFMEDFLSRLIGKKLDVYCGGSSSLRGEVVKVEMGILHLRDTDGKNCYIAVDKIVVVWEAKEDEHKAGFVPVPNVK